MGCPYHGMCGGMEISADLQLDDRRRPRYAEIVELIYVHLGKPAMGSYVSREFAARHGLAAFREPLPDDYPAWHNELTYCCGNCFEEVYGGYFDEQARWHQVSLPPDGEGRKGPREEFLPHFIKLIPHRFLDAPAVIDLETFHRADSGTAEMDLITGYCILDGKVVPAFETCTEYQAWVTRELHRHRIQMRNVTGANLVVRFKVSDYKIRSATSHLGRAYARSSSASFDFVCECTIRTSSTCNRSAAERVLLDHWLPLHNRH
jgi:hypothetical protein